MLPLTFQAQRAINITTQRVITSQPDGRVIGMCSFRKAFLFAIGIVSLAYEEMRRAIDEAVASLETTTPGVVDHLYTQHKNKETP
jgi:hypothetical protein